MSNAVAGDLGNVETLKYKQIWKKATTGGSAIAAGKVVKLTESTGVGAVAPTTAGTTGPFGVVPRLAPLNVDADDTFQVVTGGEIYVTCNGAIKPNQRVMPSTTTAGNVMAYVSPTISGAYSQAEVQAGIESYNKVVGIYVGHVDEGSGLEKEATDAADGQVIRILLGGKGESP